MHFHSWQWAAQAKSILDSTVTDQQQASVWGIPVAQPGQSTCPTWGRARGSQLLGIQASKSNTTAWCVSETAQLNSHSAVPKLYCLAAWGLSCTLSSCSSSAAFSLKLHSKPMKTSENPHRKHARLLGTWTGLFCFCYRSDRCEHIRYSEHLHYTVAWQCLGSTAQPESPHSCVAVSVVLKAELVH